MREQVCILGSTGSIGTQTLEVIEEQGEMDVYAIAAGSSLEKIKEQVFRHHPKMVCMWKEETAQELREFLKTQYREPVEVLSGMEGLIACAVAEEVTLVTAAIVGMIGIRPVLEAVKAGKKIALANKETLVTAGHLILPLAKEKNIPILPVDSEHSAIFQCLQARKEAGIDEKCVEKILLTASGGPFRTWKKEEFPSITLEQTLKHPNWSMGKKITVDSATMANKGLEVMEARWLFDVDYDRIQVVIQPQSIIHSMVQFQDGAVMAQLGTPDMRLPIQYALHYPERKRLSGERLDFAALSSITFEAPDFERFPALLLAYEAGKKGGLYPTVFNAANEWAVERFLAGKCHYMDISDAISYALSNVPVSCGQPSLEEILLAEQETKNVLENQEKCEMI